jgi:hypothetical protein
MVFIRIFRNKNEIKKSEKFFIDYKKNIVYIIKLKNQWFKKRYILWAKGKGK